MLDRGIRGGLLANMPTSPISVVVFSILWTASGAGRAYEIGALPKLVGFEPCCLLL